MEIVIVDNSNNPLNDIKILWFHVNYKIFSASAIINKVFQMKNILFDKKNYQNIQKLSIDIEQ